MRVVGCVPCTSRSELVFATRLLLPATERQPPRAKMSSDQRLQSHSRFFALPDAVGCCEATSAKRQRSCVSRARARIDCDATSATPQRAFCVRCAQPVSVLSCASGLFTQGLPLRLQCPRRRPPFAPVPCDSHCVAHQSVIVAAVEHASGSDSCAQVKPFGSVAHRSGS